MLKKIKIIFKILYYFLKSINSVKKSNFYNSEETVDYILKNNKSIIRMGDGEFAIMSGKSIAYQQHSLELQKSLQDIVYDFVKNPDDCPYLLAMPGMFLTCSGYSLLKNIDYIKAWPKARYEFKKKYDFPVMYGDAFLFAKGNENIYSKIWKSDNIESVIFVHNKIDYANKFQYIYEKEVTYINVPDKNSFEMRDEILSNILDAVSEVKKENTIILISAGPCSKYLVKHLSEKGILSIDTGHCWDNPLSIRK